MESTAENTPLQYSAPSASRAIPLSFEFCASIVLTILLFLLDKGGKANSWVFAIGLLLIYLLTVHPLLGLKWIGSGTDRARQAKKISCVVVPFFFIVPLGIWVFPIATKKPSDSGKSLGIASLTMKQLFDQDFSGSSVTQDVPQIVVLNHSRRIDIVAKMVFSLTEQTFSIAYYIPANVTPVLVAKTAAENYQQVLKERDKFRGTEVDYGGGRPMNTDDATFTNKAIVYYDGRLSLQEQAAIERAFNSQGISVITREYAYLMEELRNRKIQANPR
ncbi:hypothetical protein [Terriglobus sp. RCC_193]|uniref:hypothetical protein n=1 Tax=Terriglobus sp. RCC_193 TaxID=3239218 RepID=UPI003523DB29